MVGPARRRDRSLRHADLVDRPARAFDRRAPVPRTRAHADARGLDARMTAPAIDPVAPVRDAPAAERPRTPSAWRPIVARTRPGGLLVITLLAILLTSSALLRVERRPGGVAEARGRRRRPGPRADVPLPRVRARDGRRRRAAGHGGRAHLPPERDEGARQAARERRAPLHLRGPRERLAERLRTLPGADEERHRHQPDQRQPHDEQRQVLRRRLAAREHRPRARRGRHPLAPVVRVGERVVGDADPEPVGRGAARRQLRERIPRHRRARRVGPRLATRSRRHPRPQP